MKQTIATDPSQSQRLKACGVDPKSADLFWQMPIITSRGKQGKHILFTNEEKHELFDTDIPAYSLSRLLSLLPTSITSILGNEYFLELSKVRMHNAWEVQWHSGRCRWPTHDKSGKFCKLWDKSPIEACVKAIEWLTKEGYKLNTIEE